MQVYFLAACQEQWQWSAKARPGCMPSSP